MDNIHANLVGITKKDIYIIKNDINDKVYIGQALNSENRFNSHCKPNKDNSLIDKAIQKYGKQHFYYEILESQIENYNEKEKYWIEYYNSKTPNGYNILDGGNEPPRHSGNSHPSTKLKDEELKKLKDDLANTNLSLNKIAEKYGISKKQVMRINQGLSRADIEDSYPIRKNPNINGKLTEENADNIIQLLKYTYRLKGDIAREFGVSPNAIEKINNGETHHRDIETYPIREWKSNGKAVVTYEQVTKIIEEIINTNNSLCSISKKFNVKYNIVRGICSGSYKRYRRKELKYPLRTF